MAHRPPGRLAEWLAESGVRLEPDRDQHLLTDPAVLADLIASAGIRGTDRVLDPGAGPGTIAEAVAPHAAEVLAVEIDARFEPLLRSVKARHANIDVRVGDMLSVDLAGIDIVVGNPPFTAVEALMARVYASGVRTLALLGSPQLAVAAQAAPGSEHFTRTSAYVQAAFKGRTIRRVPPGAFLPPPSRAPALVVLHRDAGSAPLRRLASGLAHRPQERVRDLLARARVPRQSAPLPLPLQRRLQALTSTEISLLAQFLVEQEAAAPIPS